MPTDDTAPQTPITIRELRDAIFDRLDEKELATAERLDALEQRNVERHQTLVDKWNEHERRLNDHDTDIAQMRDGRFPQLPLWSLVVVSALVWLTVLVFGCLIVFYETHAAAALVLG